MPATFLREIAYIRKSHADRIYLLSLSNLTDLQRFHALGVC